MKRVMGYLQASVISLAIIAQNCEEKKGVYRAFLSVCREALVYQRSVFNTKSFKSQRIYQAIPGGDETVDLIRKGFRALQPPRMALVEAAGARPLPKFSLCILLWLIQRPLRKPQDPAESAGVGTERGEFVISGNWSYMKYETKERP